MTAVTFDEPVTALALTAAKYSTTQKQKEKERERRAFNFKQKILDFIFERKQTFVNTQLILQIRLLLEESLKSESFW